MITSQLRFTVAVFSILFVFSHETPAWAVPLEPSRDINTYALFAYDSLVWKGGTNQNGKDWGHIYNGNVGVNNPDSNPGDGNFVLDFGTSARGIMSPGSQLVGDSVRADDAADIIYQLFANTLNPTSA